MIAGGGTPAELEVLAQRFETWRRTRRGCRRIPEELWRAAADLARIQGLSRTATALKLGYHDLRRRLQGGEARDSPRRPVFVEVPGVPLPPGGGERGTVEVVAASGARLIIRMPEASPAELRCVVELFLRHGA